MTRRRENSFLRVFLFTVNMIARLAIEVYNIVYASNIIFKEKNFMAHFSGTFDF